MSTERKDPLDLATLRHRGLLSSSASLDAVDKSPVAKDALPPSPPMTDASPSTSTDSSPATISPPQMPADTPPRSSDCGSSHSTSPASPISPLPPFPTEVFANILSCLPIATVAPLCRVSRAWRQHIVNDLRLWSTLNTTLNLDEDQKCRYICQRASMSGGKRPAGGIRSLHIVLQYQRLANGRRGDVAEVGFVVERLRLRVELWPNTTTSAVLLDELGKASYAPLFAHVRDVQFAGSLPDFDLRNAFLQMWPSATSFTFAPAPRDSQIAPIPVGEWVWHNPVVYRAPRITSCDRLESLRLQNVCLGDVDLPRLPRLKHLRMDNVRWEGRGLFLLLRLARRTLETITANNLAFDPVDDPYDDWFKYVDVTDPSLADGYVPPPLSEDQLFDAVPVRLPALRKLAIAGTTPPFFATIEDHDLDVDEDDPFPTPVLQMPNLERCDLVDTNVDSEFADESLGPLAVLGQNAPRVSHLLLNSLIVGDWTVHCCLAGMHGRITNLDLYQSSVSDQLIVRLPSLVPFLKVLDVRMCDEVTPQGVARMVEVIRTLHDEGESRVERVLLDPPVHSQASLDAYRWLDFIGVLQRDDMDLEGDGPPEPEPRRRWKLEGKKDAMWAHKQEIAAREAKEREQRALEAQFAALQEAVGGGSSSGASGAAPRPFDAAMLARFGRPPSASAPVLAPAPVPPIPQYPLAPAQHGLYASAPLPQRPLAPIALHPAPTTAPPTHDVPPHLGQPQPQLHPHRPPPVFVPAQEQAHVRPAPPLPPPHAPPAPAPPVAVVEQNEADMDYSFLDGVDGGASVLAPEFVRAQADELRRMEGMMQERRRSEAQMDAAEDERREQARAAAVLVAGARGAGDLAPRVPAVADAGEEDDDASGCADDGVEADGEADAETEVDGAPVEEESFTPLV
ncbi:hypothetical protein JCM10450v2_000353 [Rhodotorula kratochvilovae]